MSARRAGAKTITDMARFGDKPRPIVRGHWAVVNSLHWATDIVFRDDECRVRTDHAPIDLTTLERIALSLTRRAHGKDPIRLKREVAAWDDVLAQIIAA